MTALFQSSVLWEELTFGLVASDRGLSAVILPHLWQDPLHPAHSLPENPALLQPYRQAFQEYFMGRRSTWDLLLDITGTIFQKEVWQALGHIPYGTTLTYGALAQMVGRPRAVRAVALAVGKNPLPVVLPCHRVVGHDGALTGYRGGLRLKERLLALEGVQGLAMKGHPRFQF